MLLFFSPQGAEVNEDTFPGGYILSFWIDTKKKKM